MKKLFLLIALIAALCIIFAGCTDGAADNGRNSTHEYRINDNDDGRIGFKDPHYENPIGKPRPHPTPLPSPIIPR
ncbi:MAG TPA: hypothetical protein DD415_02985 [Clostridiales bacterium]|nr:hypothetical protein [Clostridiales bacterium]